MSSKGVGELQIRIAILELLVDRRVWTNFEIKNALRQILQLSDYDNGKSNSREAEARWENRVNNALSPSTPNSLYASGWVESMGHGQHRITDLGHEYANSD
ncbi:MAG: winged helix-turn-helix domain-containing protein [Novosphingobium sp.]